jgi:hypothetical protein
LGGGFALLAILLLSNYAWGQCPTTIAPTTISWTSQPSKYYCLGSNCCVTVNYCTRVVGGVVEYYVTSIVGDPAPNDCNSTSWGQIIDLVHQQLLCCNPDRRCSGSLPSCSDPGPYPIAETYYQAQCWEMDYADPSSQQKMVMPCDGASLCKRSYALCCDNLGHVSAQLVGTTTVAGICNGFSVPSNDVWQLQTCYNLISCAP